MSFVRQYRRLWSIFVQEEVSGSLLPGFSLAPTQVTQRLLTDHQLLFRARPSGCEVYYQLNPLAMPSLLGGIRQRVRFTFTMQQSDTLFLQRYEPDLSPTTGAQLYLDNLTTAGTIQPFAQTALSVGNVVQAPDAMQVVPSILFASAQAGGGGAPTQWIVRNKFNPATVVRQTPISAAPGATQTITKIDLSDQPTGPYTLATDAVGASAKTIYADNALAGSKALGVIDVHWETAQDSVPTGGVAYRIRFRKR